MSSDTVNDLYDAHTPRNGYLLVRRLRGEKKLGNFFLPENASQADKLKTQRGIVIAVGDGPRSPATGEHMPMPFKVGMGVNFGRYNVVPGPFFSTDEDVVFVSEKAIFASFEVREVIIPDADDDAAVGHSEDGDCSVPVTH